MKTIKVYNPEELKKKFPDAFESAHDKFRSNETDIPWSDEIMASLKAMFERSGIALRDWSIDAYGYSYVKFDMQEDTENLSGQRAVAWLENNLLGALRERRTFRERVKKYDHWYDFTKFGEIPSCPFTGYCADDDFIESVIKAIRQGKTLKEAYSGLAHEAAKMFQSEIEYQNSEEHFLEQSHLLYTKNGRLAGWE